MPRVDAGTSLMRSAQMAARDRQEMRSMRRLFLFDHVFANA